MVSRAHFRDFLVACGPPADTPMAEYPEPCPPAGSAFLQIPSHSVPPPSSFPRTADRMAGCVYCVSLTLSFVRFFIVPPSIVALGLSSCPDLPPRVIQLRISLDNIFCWMFDCPRETSVEVMDYKVFGSQIAMFTEINSDTAR